MSNLIPISFDSLLGYSSTANVESQLGGVSNDPTINSRITAIGKRLSAKTENKSLPYQFKALNTNQINAFALPGGPTYVTVGLLNGLSPTDDELAAIMGHELGHVNARHGVKGMELSLGANFITDLIKSQLKKSEGLGLDSNDINRIDKYNKTIANFVSLGYGRDNEYEADAKGLNYMTAAGYNPYAMVSLMGKLQALEGRKTTNLEEFFSTHPATTKRISEVDDIIKTNYPAAKPLVALPQSPMTPAPSSPAPVTTTASPLKPLLWPAIGLGAVALAYGAYRIFRKPPITPITQIKGNPVPFLIREPWQMTKSEFRRIVSPKTTELTLAQKYFKETGKKIDNIRQVADYYPREWEFIQITNKLKKEIYEKLPDEIRADKKGMFGINQMDESIHENFVGQALLDGKLVSPNVLKDYPDLIRAIQHNPVPLGRLLYRHSPESTPDEIKSDVSLSEAKRMVPPLFTDEIGRLYPPERFSYGEWIWAGVKDGKHQFITLRKPPSLANPAHKPLHPDAENLLIQAKRDMPEDFTPATVNKVLKYADIISRHDWSNTIMPWHLEEAVQFARGMNPNIIWPNSLFRKGHSSREVWHLLPRYYRVRELNLPIKLDPNLPLMLGKITEFYDILSDEALWYLKESFFSDLFRGKYVDELTSKDLAVILEILRRAKNNMYHRGGKMIEAVDLLNVMERLKPVRPNPAPEFKSTEEAVAYGKRIFGRKDKIEELGRALERKIMELEPYKRSQHPDYQEMSDIACQKSFISEALQAAGMVKANPSTDKLLALATIIPGIPPL